MNVWIMNLKDNREEKPADLSQSKFEFCKEKGIVGIGWAKPEAENAEDVAFSQAENAIDAFEIGDLVWVKNTSAENDTEKHYICKITEKAVKTDDDIMNKYDIGKYCACEYIPVQSLPDELDGEKIFARHTIERANETVTEKTQSLVNPVRGKKKKSKVKIGIIAGICALVLVLGVIFVPKAIGFVNMKTHPILPDGLEFGMTYDEIKRTTNYFDSFSDPDYAFESHYDKLSRSYSIIVGEAFQYEGLPIKLNYCTLGFTKDKQLNEITYFGDGDDTENFDILCKYFEKAFNSTPTMEESDRLGLLCAKFSSDDIECDVVDKQSFVYIKSHKYATQIPEISKQSIAAAFDSLSYKISGFSMNLSELIDSCVSNIETTYCTADEALNEFQMIDEKEINELTNGDYAEYAATSYLVTVHGDILKNPDIPYLKTEDVDVIKVMLVFDDYGELMAYKIIEECDDLYTCAVLTMCG